MPMNAHLGMHGMNQGNVTYMHPGHPAQAAQMHVGGAPRDARGAMGHMGMPGHPHLAPPPHYGALAAGAGPRGYAQQQQQQQQQYHHQQQQYGYPGSPRLPRGSMAMAMPPRVSF